jgi:IS1 family transposase
LENKDLLHRRLSPLRQRFASQATLYRQRSNLKLEKNNGRQRHWFARFRRKSIVIGRFLTMLELTMRIFATFHVNSSDKK